MSIWLCVSIYESYLSKTKERKMLTRKETALKTLLNIEKGEIRAFPEFCVVLSNVGPDGTFYIHWKKRFHTEKYGSSAIPSMLNNPEEGALLNNYECYWGMYPMSDDWDNILYNKVMDSIKSLTGLEKQMLRLRYYSGTYDLSQKLPDKQTLFKARYKNITNKNLCKIDCLKLTGDVRFIHGVIMSDRRIMFDELNDNIVHVETDCLLKGDVSPCLYGDISGVIGTIRNDLIGDISGITGDVTNICGDCSGIKLHIKSRTESLMNINALVKRPLSGRRHLLSNEDSQKAFNVYRKLAHCTLGLTTDERTAIDRPTKFSPPFKIDKWGRYYAEKDGSTYVYSINPADIMFLKEIGPLNSCFCMTSQSANGRWHCGMRALMALNCTNPSLACVFKISNDEPVRRMRMFKDLDFMWFKPIAGGFFQYNANGEGECWARCDDVDVEDQFLPIKDKQSIVPIYGHDGINIGHERQNRLAYLELFIKDEHSWLGNRDYISKSENKITNNHWDICYDKDWNELTRSDDGMYNKYIPDDDTIVGFIEEAKMAKEIIDGIKV